MRLLREKLCWFKLLAAALKVIVDVVMESLSVATNFSTTSGHHKKLFDINVVVS